MKYNFLATIEKRSLSILALILIAASATSISIVGSVLLSQTRVQSKPPETSDPAQEKINAVAALGYLEPRGELVRLYPPASSERTRVEKLLIKVGDNVNTGQTIAILDTRDRLEAALKKAQTQVLVARANLDLVKAGAKQGEIRAQEARVGNLEAELQGQIIVQQNQIQRLEADFQGQKEAQQAAIERLKAELNNARTECTRYQNLFKEEAVTTSERDSKCLAQETSLKRLQEAEVNLTRIITSSQKEIAEAKANLQRTKNTNSQQQTEAKFTLNKIAEVRSVDVAVAAAELENAKAAVKQAQAELDTAYVKSPETARVLKIHTKPGEVVSNEGIIDLGQTDEMYVRAEVYETDITRVRLGQPATITSQGFEGAIVGKVDEIGLQIGKKDVLGTDPVADIDARVVEVRIRLNPADSQRVQGLTNLQVKAVIDTP